MLKRAVKFVGLGAALVILALSAGDSGQIALAQTSQVVIQSNYNSWHDFNNGAPLIIAADTPAIDLIHNLQVSSGWKIVAFGENELDFIPAVNGSTRDWAVSMQYGGRLNLLTNDDLKVGRDLYVQGSKNFIVDDPTDPTRVITYASLEGPEVGTYIRGTAQLVNGEAIIELPEHFSLVTDNNGLTVQLTPLGEWLQLYVVEKNTKQIIVREAGGKSGEFDYVIQGIRKGYENYTPVKLKADVYNKG